MLLLYIIDEYTLSAIHSVVFGVEMGVAILCLPYIFSYPTVYYRVLLNQPCNGTMSTMEHYELLAGDYGDPITGDFTTKLPALCILHRTEEYCGFFLINMQQLWTRNIPHVWHTTNVRFGAIELISICFVELF